MKITFLGLFRTKRKRSKKRRVHKGKNSRRQEELRKLKSDLDNLKAQFSTVNILLRKHDEQITENSMLVERSSKQMDQLEQLVARSTIDSPKVTVPAVNRPIRTIDPPPDHMIEETSEAASQRLEINSFSEQERRILAVFFQNQDMLFSYADIASTLDKSPHTIKNQLREIRLKADLFEKTVDKGSRNRFKLKDGLRIEKYLNVR